MNFLKRIASLFTGGGGGGTNSRFYPIYVLSRRCNEPIAGQIDLLNELSLTEEDDSAYYGRKVLHTSGERRCFDQVEVLLWFDRNKRLCLRARISALQCPARGKCARRGCNKPLIEELLNAI